jgi:rare lipoprotein A (peptidoglycan hydrolase)
VSASGNGITIQTTESGLLRHELQFTGTAPTADAGDVVEIERTGLATSGLWAPTAHATIAGNGAFTVDWRANHPGQFEVEAVLVSASQLQNAVTGISLQPNASTLSSTASGPVTITVYQTSLATQYGPGFYGHKTACNIRLGRSTVGIASRTLKCGTEVSVYYGGSTIEVPVIDRGPYANGATWDLTEATAAALGITGSATIGAIQVPVKLPAAT